MNGYDSQCMLIKSKYFGQEDAQRAYKQIFMCPSWCLNTLDNPKLVILYRLSYVWMQPHRIFDKASPYFDPLGVVLEVGTHVDFEVDGDMGMSEDGDDEFGSGIVACAPGILQEIRRVTNGGIFRLFHPVSSRFFHVWYIHPDAARSSQNAFHSASATQIYTT
ncbi:hypothetical protein BDP27DRAFT_1367959 [Rhodocollybia butyracea]|uniref:Uncharacterized protein n=1 Tax=Rhodocollybia butyracea TaxID=206335 RepID=A0A9P5U1B8_9AGAR|nr:hypothetical protein BDP27DRAFT_1367959 [Rhodocollybia butyracea]